MALSETQTSVLTLTPAAVAAVKDLLAKRNLEGYALRVFVSGGGCAGFQYGMALDPEVRETDVRVQCDGVTVVVDEISIEYLRGATIDYVEDLMGSGFRIENPNAVSTCGCGHSFRTDEEAATEGHSGGCGCGA